MIPAPEHLRNCTAPLEYKARENEYVCKVQCDCGCKYFEMLHTGATQDWLGQIVPCCVEIDEEFFFRVAAKCRSCNKEHLLLDDDFHGWDGYLWGAETGKQRRPRPQLVSWKCRGCFQKEFESIVIICCDEKDQLIEDEKGKLNDTNWQEAFGWMYINIKCTNCGDAPKTWVEAETT